MAKWLNRVISVFEYLVAGYMILAGTLTAIIQPDPDVTNFMHALYGTRAGVVIVGLIIVIAGGVLLVGKIRGANKQHGQGLFSVYLCFTFAAVLNAVAYGGDPTVWVSNAIMAIIMGALWLRWRFKTEYIHVEQLYSEVKHFGHDPPPLP